MICDCGYDCEYLKYNGKINEGYFWHKKSLYFCPECGQIWLEELVEGLPRGFRRVDPGLSRGPIKYESRKSKSKEAS